MPIPHPIRFVACLIPALLLALIPSPALGGGPRLVAGSSFFNPAVMGQPVRWPSGQVNYYVDQGPLSATLSNEQATAMVDAAAASWSAVATAGVTLINKGQLAEDVSGSSTVAGDGTLLQPSDVTASATGFPLAVIYDYDGSVMDSVLGTYTSDPDNCDLNAVRIWVDNILPDATVAHAVMILNGRCTDTPNRVTMMNFLLQRAFGLVLGLGHSQVWPTWKHLAAARELARHAARLRLLFLRGRQLHPQPRRLAARRYRLAQPSLSHHRRQPGRVPR